MTNEAVKSHENDNQSTEIRNYLITEIQSQEDNDTSILRGSFIIRRFSKPLNASDVKRGYLQISISYAIVSPVIRP